MSGEIKTPIQFTYEDYLQLPEDRRYEIIDGELTMVPSPATEHQRIVIAISSALYNFVHDGKIGEVFVSPMDVVLSDVDVVQPDIFFVSKKRNQIITETNIQGAPDFIVEVLSPFSIKRDYAIKRKLYSKYEVLEYWIVDPVKKQIEKMLFQQGILHSQGIYRTDDVIESKAIEGFSLKVGSAFGESAR